MIKLVSISAWPRWMLLVLSAPLMLATLVSAAPTSSSTPDPRAVTIRRGLERVGLRVVSVEFGIVPGTGPVWLAATKGNYGRPSWRRVNDQAFVMWNVMFIALKKGTTPETYLTTAQDWAGYRLFLSSPLRDFAALSAAANKSEAEKSKAMDAFTKVMSLTFRVFDLKQQRLVDPLAFVNQHFVSE